MGVITRIRNWFASGQSEAPNPQLVLIEIMRDMQRETTKLQMAQNAIVEKMLEQGAAQTALVQSMLDMWKPPARANTSTSLNERLFNKEIAEQDKWESIDDFDMDRVIDQVLGDVEFVK